MKFPYQEFDLPTLQKIASLTGAEHYWAQDLEALKKTFSTIDQLEKTDAKSFSVIEDIELFPWFLGIALLSSLGAAFYLVMNPPQTS
jgi:Ca-activated chloride channel family protein